MSLPAPHNSDPTDELFRRAAEAEDGMPVSAGAQAIHTRDEVRLDLSGVPVEGRPTLIAELREAVRRAAVAHAP